MFKGRILIVGGRGFIGKDLTTKLQNLGYECIVTSSKNSGNPNYLDLKSKDSIESLCNQMEILEGVIFLSGKPPEQNLDELSWEHLNEMTAVHLTGIIWCIKKLKNKIRQNGFCLFTSSVAAKRGSYDPTYSSLKAGVEGLTRTLARELAPGIRVNCISPGLVEGSPVFKKMTDDFRDNHLKSTPLKKFCSLNDISGGFLFAIENSALTGQIIQINGGQFFG